jgi:acetylornithine deacetylase
MPGETLAHGREEIVTALHEVAEGDEWLREHPPEVSWDSAGFPAWDTDPGEHLVAVLAGAVEAVGGNRELGAVTFGSDAGHFAQAGVPVVIFGPGSITDAHAPNESVAEDEVLVAAKVLALTIARYRPGGPAQ